MDDCPFCAAGNKPLKTVTIDFARLRIEDIPRVFEAVRKADRVIFMSLEMNEEDARKLLDSVK